MYRCGTDLRRALVRETKVVNGIDYLEVSDDQRSVFVHFVLPLTGPDRVPAGPALGPENIVIAGGVRRRDIEVTGVSASGDVLTVDVSIDGDFSTYTLTLRGTDPDYPERPPRGFDPRLSDVDFSFKAGCGSEFDCPRAGPPPAGPPVDEPQIDYLAKDYASFRRLMLDRMSVTTPRWTERSPADLTVMLVELLAHAADRLSYRQDAAGTEAYLSTARHRVSVRRHARLLDYRMHDGANARAFVHIEVRQDVKIVRPGHAPANASTLDAGTRLLAGSPDQGSEPIVFLPLHDQQLREKHNDIALYGWGEQDCVLPAGATAASLADDGLDLHPGDLLLLEAVPGTPSQVVRLTEVGQLPDLVTGTNVVDVAWDPADALATDLPLATTVVRGNVIVVDHGVPVTDEPRPAAVPPSGRYRPSLAQAPLTFAAPYDPTRAAAQTLRTDPREAQPAVLLHSPGLDWSPRRDLLPSDAFDPGFVVEVEADGTALLRFGDDQYGRAPEPGEAFTADYRVGNGSAGNLPAGAITGCAPADPRVRRITSPLPAAGGVEPEPAELVKLLAPQAYRSPERAVTEADYAAVAQRHPGVQKALARLRWTGSWHTVFITVDRTGGAEVTPEFETEVRAFLERFRRAGHDVEINGPVPVPLTLALAVSVHRDALAEDVKAALLDALGSRGRGALFHPDNFTFGQPLYLSQVYRAALSVPGVASATVNTLHRFGTKPPATVPEVVPAGPLEILCLANDPNFPERGRLDLTVAGGR
jgi:hypothetical protein